MPPGPDELLNHGIALSGLGRIEEALAAFDQILLLAPDHFAALNNRGVVLARLERFEDAIRSFDLAFRAKPDFAETLNNRGLAHARLGRYSEAAADLDRALAIKPTYFEALDSRSDVLIALGRFEDAIASDDRLLAIKPAYVKALIRRGNVFEKLDRYEEALASYERVLDIDPRDVDALNNRGTMLNRLLRLEDALGSYDRALDVRPDFVEALSNRSQVLARLGRFDDALEGFDEAQKLQPSYPAAHVHEGIIRLQMGDYATGLRKYEWRWLEPRQGPARRSFVQPLWMGKPDLRGKTILLHAEQGLGDLIQFVRYVPMVAAKGAEVLLEVPQQLVPLLSGLAGVNRLVPWGETLPVTDFHCPLLSLPLAFGTTLETIPADGPYLSVPKKTVTELRTKLRHEADKLVGVSWRGSPSYKKDRERSIRFADFAPLLTVPGVRFVSLQKELNEDEGRLATGLSMVHPGGDFKSTGELIGALDLVISVDSAWSHWAGAIGVPVWVLLSFSPDWRWHLDRDDCPWYPTARLFRQATAGDWKGVIRKLRDSLRVFARQRKSRGIA